MPLGCSSVEVSALGLGTAAIGGLYTPVTPDEAAAVVLAALDAGITYFDTAPLYGLGESERRLGRALVGVDRSGIDDLDEGRPAHRAELGRRYRRVRRGRPADIVLDFSAEGVHRSLEASLERLGLDRVDVVFVHDRTTTPIRRSPRPTRRWSAGAPRGSSAIGVGMNQTAVPLRFVRETDIDVVLLAGRWTLLDQSGLAELLPAACTAAGVSSSVACSTATCSPIRTGDRTTTTAPRRSTS